MINKKELIRKVAFHSGETMGTTEKVLDTLTDVIVESLEAGDEVKLPGLVKFVFHESDEKMQYSPQKGKKIKLRPRKKVKAKTLSKLKDIDLFK